MSIYAMLASVLVSNPLTPTSRVNFRSHSSSTSPRATAGVHNCRFHRIFEGDTGFNPVVAPACQMIGSVFGGSVIRSL
ncbi:hypothetical protein PSTG_19237, partial [Puccinia striiformis f. sp. tritici PST-78]